jgi:gamma-glutamyltranspeptidase/glutathione hydrolase
MKFMIGQRSISIVALILLSASSLADERRFAGVVASASPEATAAGVEILEAGVNAIEAAIAVSLALAVTEPAGSGIAGQTVMLVRQPGKDAVVIQGTTWSPRDLPADATAEQLQYGRTAAAVPSTLRVLDVAFEKFGSGKLLWPDLVAPAIHYAEAGFEVGPFRHRSFRNSADDLRKQDAARQIFIRDDNQVYQVGERFRQPILADTLQRIADNGAMDFYAGAIAREIADDMAANNGWITARDLNNFPEPAIVPAIKGTYRNYDIETLPPPFAGWVVLQILNILELEDASGLDEDDAERRLSLLDAMRIAHGNRRSDPVLEYKDYESDVAGRTDKSAAVNMLLAYRERIGGETTHFSVVDGDGTAVAVTQSIDSYFGARVVHPKLGFLYNNYMQGFQVDDPAAPYYLEERQMPLSSMSATIVSRNGDTLLALGSPGSARIISAVAQVTSHWIDIDDGIDAAVSAYRVHVVPDDKAYVEGQELGSELLGGMADRGFRLIRPTYGVSDSQLDAYFGGVHAVALEDGAWTGAADPRRDGTVGVAWR